MSKILEVISHIFTARDGVSYSLSKLAGITGIVAVTYNFVKLDSADFQGYGIAIAGLIAALAIKYAVEEK